MSASRIKSPVYRDPRSAMTQTGSALCLSGVFLPRWQDGADRLDVDVRIEGFLWSAAS
jgi:hypothetical protein